jgi:hypothetical protein
LLECTKTPLDILGIFPHTQSTSLIEGRQPVTPIDGAGCGACGSGLVSRALGRPRGPRPTGTTTGARGASLNGVRRGSLYVRKRGPGSVMRSAGCKASRGGAPRGERPTLLGAHASKRRQVAQTASTCLRRRESVGRASRRSASPHVEGRESLSPRMRGGSGRTRRRPNNTGGEALAKEIIG